MWSQRIRMVLDAAELLAWLDERGLLFCDFHANQFGVSRADGRLKALDMDAVRLARVSEAGRGLFGTEQAFARFMVQASATYLPRTQCARDADCLNFHPLCLQGKHFASISEHRCGADGRCGVVGPATHVYALCKLLATPLLQTVRMRTNNVALLTRVNDTIARCTQTDAARRPALDEVRAAFERILADYGTSDADDVDDARAND